MIILLTFIYHLYYVISFFIFLFLAVTSFKKMRHWRDKLFKALKKYKVTSILAFSIFMFLPSYEMIQPLYFLNKENAMIYELLDLDISAFLNGVYLFFMVVFMFTGIVSIAMNNLGFSFDKIVSVGTLMLIFGFAFSIILSMLFTFNKEQFDIATSVISFITIFSFIFSKTFVSHIFSVMFKYLPKNLDEENKINKEDSKNF